MHQLHSKVISKDTELSASTDKQSDPGPWKGILGTYTIGAWGPDGMVVGWSRLFGPLFLMDANAKSDWGVATSLVIASPGGDPVLLKTPNPNPTPAHYQPQTYFASSS